MSYPHERQIEYWTSRDIEQYFANLSYAVIVLPNSQRLEKHIPFDHLFAGGGIKVFGLQYKRLYDAPDRWRLDHAQHLQLGRYPWIFYALSEVRTIQENRNALHLLRIVTPKQLPIALVTTSCKVDDIDSGVRYARWGGFALGLAQCRFGLRVDTPQELRAVFAQASDLGEALIDLYFMTLNGRRILVRSSPFVTGFDDQETFDVGFEADVSNSGQ